MPKKIYIVAAGLNLGFYELEEEDEMGLDNLISFMDCDSDAPKTPHHLLVDTDYQSQQTEHGARASE